MTYQYQQVANGWHGMDNNIEYQSWIIPKSIKVEEVKVNLVGSFKNEQTKKQKPNLTSCLRGKKKKKRLFYVSYLRITWNNIKNGNVSSYKYTFHLGIKRKLRYYRHEK